jgi:hypothetical protein
LALSINTFTIRQHIADVAERLEQELGDEQFCFVEGCQRIWDELPSPDGPLTVGIDGGYVRGQHKQGQFEVIAGKSLLAFKRDQEGKQQLSGRCFAWVQTYDEKPKRRLFELLQSRGMQPNQQVDFLSDGGEDVRNVQLYLNPQAEHLLDWFHLTMRLTVLNQTAKGLPERIGEGEDQYGCHPGDLPMIQSSLPSNKAWHQMASLGKKAAAPRHLLTAPSGGVRCAVAPTQHRNRTSQPDSLHLAHCNLVLCPIVKFGCSRRLMSSHLLGVLEPSAFFLITPMLTEVSDR